MQITPTGSDRTPAPRPGGHGVPGRHQQGSALLMTLLLISGLMAITMLGVTIAANQTKTSQETVSKNNMEAATAGDSQIITGLMQSAMPSIIESSMNASPIWGWTAPVGGGASPGSSSAGAAPDAFLPALQRALDSTFCNTSGGDNGPQKIAIFVTQEACGQRLPRSLSDVTTVRNNNVMTWQVPVAATWKHDGNPYMLTGTATITGGTAGSGRWTYLGDDVTLTPALTTNGNILANRSLTIQGHSWIGGILATRGCAGNNCRSPEVVIGSTTTAVNDLRPTPDHPCTTVGCAETSLGFSGAAPSLKFDQGAPGIASTSSINWNGNATLEMWYGPWNSLYQNRPVAPNTRNVLPAGTAPTQGFKDTVVNGKLVTTHMIADQLTMTQFYRLCTPNDLASCQIYYSWDSSTNRSLIKATGSIRLSNLLDSSTAGGTGAFPVLGKNRQTVVQAGGDINIASDLTFPEAVCVGRTEVSFTSGHTNAKLPTCEANAAAGIDPTQQTLLGIRSTGGNIDLDPIARSASSVNITAAIWAETGSLPLLNASNQVNITGSLQARTIAPGAYSNVRAEPDPRLVNGLLNPPGFPIATNKVFSVSVGLTQPFRTDQIDTTQ